MSTTRPEYQISVMEQLQAELVYELRRHSFIHDNAHPELEVPVTYELKKDVAEEIANNWKRSQIAILITTPTADVEGADIETHPGPFYNRIKIVAAVAEVPNMNTTGKPALKVAEWLASALSGFKPTNMSFRITPDSPTIFKVPPDDNDEDRDRLLYGVAFSLQGQLGDLIHRVAQPGLFPTVDGKLKLECATEGAAIWYSLDDSFPRPDCGTHYTAPIRPATFPCRLRARAYKDEWQTSDELFVPLTGL